MSEQLATRKQDPLKLVLSNPNVQSRISEILGKRAPQFCSSVVSLVNANDRLREADPASVVASCMTAALLNLPISKDLGFAHIVPYSGVAQFQMGYKGFVQLAMRTGQYKHLNACPVHEGELLSYDKLSGELVLDPNFDDESAKVIGWAAYMELVNGFKHALYWTDEQVQKHAEKFSQAVKKKKTDSPWFTNRDVMCMKTVLKALLSKWGILSIELETAMREDQGIKRTIDADTEFIDNTKPAVPMPKSTDEPAATAGQPVATPAASQPAADSEGKDSPKDAKEATNATGEPKVLTWIGKTIGVNVGAGKKPTTIILDDEHDLKLKTWDKDIVKLAQALVESKQDAEYSYRVEKKDKFTDNIAVEIKETA